MKYCTYLTIYLGNKLPMFYIGFTRTEKIAKGYHGTVTSKKYSKIWKEELTTRPELFKTQILTHHSIMRDAKEKETFLQQYFNVATNSMYINAYVQGQHFCVDRTGIKHTPEACAKIKAARQGRSPVKKGTTLTIEHKQKIAASLAGIPRPPEVIEKIANSRRGRKNLKKFSDESNTRRSETLKKQMTDEKRAHLSEISTGEKNAFYGKRHSEETKKHLQEIDRSYLKEMFWWTNGTTIIRSKVCPGDDFVRGRKLN